MTDEERIRQALGRFILGRPHKHRHGLIVGRLVELVETIRAEAMAEQREKDAEICDNLRKTWRDLGLRGDNVADHGAGCCAAAIRNQD